MTRTAGVLVSLDDLISSIAGAQADPLDQLASAVVLADHLDAVADQLVGHFVEQARTSGASWAEIGRTLGVSKQAVQQRFTAKQDLDPSQGFSRFSDRARAVVVVAQTEARAASNPKISIAHLLLGLVSDPSCGAGRILHSLGIELSDVRTIARATLPSAAEMVPQLIPFDAHAQAALTQTFGVSGRLGDDRIGTEHILLAVLEVEDGTGVLAGLGVTSGDAETALRSTPAVAWSSAPEEN